jgi:ribonuclease G
LAEWLFEQGIGENRAILIENGAIAEALVEWPGELLAGTVLAGRISKILVPGKRAIVALATGADALLEPIPAGLAEGARIRAEVVREALPEPGRPKLARVKVTDADERAGPWLRDRLESSGHTTKALSPTDPDLFEQSGWSELLEEAAGGEIPFEGGSLRMSLTPAMTLFDVDGALPPAALAVAGAQAAGRAIRRFAIGGSIGIDLPTLPSREDRQKAALALDAVLAQPFERTAVNGFGFLQVVRRRERASLPERIQGDPAGAAARALMRLAERSPGMGPRTLHATPSVAARIKENPDWLDALGRGLGAPVALRAEPGLAISAGYVHSQFPR